MIIYGIKLSHDGTIALIDNGTLVFCYEMEKIDNNARHSTLSMSIDYLVQVLSENGYTPDMVSEFVIDG